MTGARDSALMGRLAKQSLELNPTEVRVVIDRVKRVLSGLAVPEKALSASWLLHELISRQANLCYLVGHTQTPKPISKLLTPNSCSSTIELWPDGNFQMPGTLPLFYSRPSDGVYENA